MELEEDAATADEENRPLMMKLSLCGASDNSKGKIIGTWEIP